MIVTDAPAFVSVEAALAFAFRAPASSEVRISSAYGQRSGGGGALAGLSALEQRAQRAMIRSVVISLGDLRRTVIEYLYESQPQARAAAEWAIGDWLLSLPEIARLPRRSTPRDGESAEQMDANFRHGVRAIVSQFAGKERSIRRIRPITGEGWAIVLTRRDVVESLIAQLYASARATIAGRLETDGLVPRP